MTCRLTIRFEPEEADALARLAVAELREPREQARFLVRQELIRLGVLKAEKDERGKDPSPRTCLESTGA